MTFKLGSLLQQYMAGASNQSTENAVGHYDQVAALGPGALAALTQGAGGAASQLGRGTVMSPQNAAQLSPEQVREIAQRAEQHNPSVVDQMSDFYAQHSGLVTTLGSAALTQSLWRRSLTA